MIAKFGTALPALVLCASAAAAMPADCSKGPVPKGAFTGKIAGVTFAPKEITLLNTGNMSENATRFDTYTLTFREPTGEAASRSIDTIFLVLHGQKPDGHTYRAVPGDVGAQPKAADTSFAEVQGWNISDDDHDVDIHSVSSFTGSLQVSFGRRAGNAIPGTYYICSPDRPASWAGGSFAASLTQQ